MLVRCVWVWEQDGRVWARLETNAREDRLREKLRRLGEEDLVDHVERHEDLLRLNGGSYMLVRCRSGVCREQALAVLERL
jgi:hypothetical protein